MENDLWTLMDRSPEDVTCNIGRAVHHGPPRPYDAGAGAGGRHRPAHELLIETVLTAWGRRCGAPAPNGTRRSEDAWVDGSRPLTGPE